jgi:hypothetical protein
MREAPLLEYSSRHRGGGPGEFGRFTGARIVEQPRFEGIRLGVVLDRALQQVPLYPEPEGIGSLIALSLPPSSFRRFEGGKQRPAHIGGPKGR